MEPFTFDPDFSIPFSSLSLSEKHTDMQSSNTNITSKENDYDPMETASDMQRVLFVKKSTRYANIICAICQQAVGKYNLEITPCGHVFHAKCLMGWTRTAKKDTCPTCRTRLRLNSDNETNEIPIEFNVTGQGDWVREGLEEALQDYMSGPRPTAESTVTIVGAGIINTVEERWSLSDPYSPIHMLPINPSPQHCLMMLLTMSTHMYLAPYLTEDEFTTDDMAEKWNNFTRDGAGYLPTAWRRNTWRWSNSSTDWFRVIDASLLDWNNVEPTLNIGNLSDESNIETLSLIQLGRHANRPEILVKWRHEDNASYICLKEVWVPQMPGTLPSISGGLIVKCGETEVKINTRIEQDSEQYRYMMEYVVPIAYSVAIHELERL